MTKRKAVLAPILRDLRLVFAGVVLMLTGFAAPAQAEDKTLLLYGDSLMAGLGLEAPDAFAAQLQDALDAEGLSVRVVNASVSGDTSKKGLDRLDWVLADTPDAVILELGANDMLQGLPVAAMEDNLSAILDRFAADKVPVLLAGMQANPNLGDDYVAAYNAVFPALAQRYGAAIYPFFLDGVALDASLNQRDAMHPNADGVKVIVGRILPSVVALLSAP